MYTGMGIRCADRQHLTGSFASPVVCVSTSVCGRDECLGSLGFCIFSADGTVVFVVCSGLLVLCACDVEVSSSSWRCRSERGICPVPSCRGEEAEPAAKPPAVQLHDKLSCALGTENLDFSPQPLKMVGVKMPVSLLCA